ncbi:MAG: hypothetical protein EOO27_40970 [Comamonadaceae bacterium]|nr:MAG: hypothetical protein EOO27_40970 [Comamonadaceae bacterium]
MQPARLWLRTFCAGFVIITALLIVTLFTPPPYGDLSRIGRLSDAQFGWLQPPPEVDPKLLHGVPLDQADVLIVGDSFSMTFYWQSALVRAGYRVATTYWGEIGYLCSNFSDRVREAGFQGKLVIVESVEREMHERLLKSEQCPLVVNKKLQPKTEPFTKPLTQKPQPGLNWSAKLTTGVITYLNTRRAVETKSDEQFGDETLVRGVVDGCRQFSHQLCDRAPFFKEDIDNGALTAADFERLQRITRGQSIPLMWMVIPNKTTVYVDPMHSRPFVQALDAARYGPNLFAFAEAERFQVRDFYFPNDTHLSMHGQLALGERMLQAVKEVVPLPSERKP